MKLSVITLIVLLSFGMIRSYGQELPLTKKTLNKIFRESTKGIKGNPNRFLSNHEWILCSTDSSILKSDTISLHNYKYAYFEPNCCNCITWVFYKRHSFRKYINHFCEEPPISRFYITDFWFRIKLKTIDHMPHIIVFRSGKLVYDFIVAKIGYNKMEGTDKYPFITLVNSHRTF